FCVRGHFPPPNVSPNALELKTASGHGDAQIIMIALWHSCLSCSSSQCAMKAKTLWEQHASAKEVSMTIRALVWGENIHEHKSEVVASLDPQGMHEAIANLLRDDAGISASTVVLQDPEHGLTEDVLANTDVLLWWGHA